MASAPASPVKPRGTWRAWARAVCSPRAVSHGGVVALVMLVLLGELSGAWSMHLQVAAVLTAPREQARAAHTPALEALGLPISLAPFEASGGQPLPAAPALQRPLVVPSAFQAYHQLARGDTLGAVAERYGIGLEALIWSNDLADGDALIEGQLLRIPRIAGLTHTVLAGETLDTLAERFGVSASAIAAFAPNSVPPDLQLRPGAELFIPGAARPLPADWLSSGGGLEGLARRGPEPAGLVRETQTNLRTGPSTEHPRVAQLEAGRQVALRARHEDWLQIELGPLVGWIRQDMLEVPVEWVEALPETNDFPVAPPRWVWPARGTISSRFGPRWGSFHNGLDIANRAWTPIVAARAGSVTEAGWCSGYGYCVKLSHGGGVETIYGHLIDRPVVRAGDEVAAGERIGSMGSTYDRAGGGYSTGVHLHFTVTVNGRAVDPLRFLP